jgi:hypothetical protein
MDLRDLRDTYHCIWTHSSATLLGALPNAKFDKQNARRHRAFLVCGILLRSHKLRERISPLRRPPLNRLIGKYVFGWSFMMPWNDSPERCQSLHHSRLVVRCDDEIRQARVTAGESFAALPGLGTARDERFPPLGLVYAVRPMRKRGAVSLVSTALENIIRKLRGAPLDSGPARARVAPSASLYRVTLLKSLLKRPSGQTSRIFSTSACLTSVVRPTSRSKISPDAKDCKWLLLHGRHWGFLVFEKHQFLEHREESARELWWLDVHPVLVCVTCRS